MCTCTHVEKEFAIKIIDVGLFMNLDLKLKLNHLNYYAALLTHFYIIIHQKNEFKF